MSLAKILTKVKDWVLRTSAMREARAGLFDREDSRMGALRQARLLLEVARRVAEPIKALPSGARPTVLLALYRDAVYWALVAGRSGTKQPAPDLETLWGESPPGELLAAARDPATLDAVRAVLLDSVAPRSLDATEEDAARARGFAEALAWRLDAPRRRVDQVLGQRWGRIILVGAVALSIGFGAEVLTRGPNLAADKAFRTSSTYADCGGDGSCDALLFHTRSELNPWVEFDLGAPKTFRSIEVTNRRDCCQDRAVPLVAEISDDGAQWTEVARRETDFTSWTAKFRPKTARFVRLRVPRESALHLEQVEIR